MGFVVCLAQYSYQTLQLTCILESSHAINFYTNTFVATYLKYICCYLSRPVWTFREVLSMNTRIPVHMQ